VANIFRTILDRARALTAPRVSAITPGGWQGIIREPYTGAWQANAEIRPETVIQQPTVFSCFSLISSDIKKLRLRLVELDEDGIWREATNPAFSPVLRKPNRYQTMPQFLESWLLSKLQFGNTYVLKSRDIRGLVTALYVLNPAQVTPLVAPDGAVYYQLKRDELASAFEEETIIPAEELIHDRWMCLFHPLVGISPLYAAAGVATQGLTIQQNSTAFFANGSQPAGIILIPGGISDEQATRARDLWKSSHGGANRGSTAVLTHGMTYQPLTQSAVDSQLTEQEKRIVETIAGVLHVPASFIDASHAPPYGNNEAVVQQYYSQCLQVLMTDLEVCLDEGLGLDTPTGSGTQYGVEFDLDDLVWFDLATKTKAAADAIGSGAMAPNEARAKYFNLGPVPGGDTPFLQMQYLPLDAVAAGTRPPPKTQAATPEPMNVPAEDDEVLG
jgi:HK97 family phage portal protein